MSKQLNPAPLAQIKSFKNYNAGFISRLLAFIIDVVTITLIVLVFNLSMSLVLNFFKIDVSSLLQSGETLAIAIAVFLIFINVITTILLWLFYFVGSWVLVGQTLGKNIMGLRVVAYDGNLITVKYAFIRYIGYWLSAIPFFLGYLWVLVDDDRRAWHDKLAKTNVIYYWDARFGPMLQQKIKEAQAIESKNDQPEGESTGSQTKKRLPG